MEDKYISICFLDVRKKSVLISCQCFSDELSLLQACVFIEDAVNVRYASFLPISNKQYMLFILFLIHLFL